MLGLGERPLREVRLDAARPSGRPSGPPRRARRVAGGLRGRSLTTGPTRAEPNMPKYQMYFDTKDGWKLFNVEIDEDETLGEVMPNILFEIRDNGCVMEGQPEGSGDIYVTCDGRDLDMTLTLPDQGVRSNDVLRVAVGLEVPSLQLSRQNKVYDVIQREELFEGDDIIVGKTILRFHVGKRRQHAVNKQATLIQRLQEGRSFKQTVYFMSLVGAIAGLACWGFNWLIAFALDNPGINWTTVIDFSTLGTFIGALSIGFNDKWLSDRVVGRWIVTGALVGTLAGAVRSEEHTSELQSR